MPKYDFRLWREQWIGEYSRLTALSMEAPLSARSVASEFGPDGQEARSWRLSNIDLRDAIAIAQAEDLNAATAKFSKYVSATEADFDIPYIWLSDAISKSNGRVAAISFLTLAARHCCRKSLLLQAAGEIALFTKPSDVNLALLLLSQSVLAAQTERDLALHPAAILTLNAAFTCQLARSNELFDYYPSGEPRQGLTVKRVNEISEILSSSTVELRVDSIYIMMDLVKKHVDHLPMEIDNPFSWTVNPVPSLGPWQSPVISSSAFSEIYRVYYEKPLPIDESELARLLATSTSVKCDFCESVSSATMAYERPPERFRCPSCGQTWSWRKLANQV